jgi:hypothetical protein
MKIVGELDRVDSGDHGRIAPCLDDYLSLMAKTPNVFVDGNLPRLVAGQGPVDRGLVPLLSDIRAPWFIEASAVDTIWLWLSGQGVKTSSATDAGYFGEPTIARVWRRTSTISRSPESSTPA